MHTVGEVQSAIDQLARSNRGVNTLRILFKWLDADGIGLDACNQAAVCVLLEAAWGQWSGTVRDMMREAIPKRKTKKKITHA